MRLPISQSIKGAVYVGFEPQSPNLDAITDSRRMVDSGSFFQAMRPFCNDIIASLQTEEGTIVEDPIAIKSIVPKLYYKNIEYIVLQGILKHYDDDDGIEGIYYCPLCGAEWRAEYRNTDGMIIDTRDRISELKVNYSNGSFNPLVHVPFTTPVKIIDKTSGDSLDEIASIDIETPTLEHCINAEGRVGSKDQVKLQIAIYIEAMKNVNGNEVDSKYKYTFGQYIFGKIRDVKKDLGRLSDQINAYGLDRTVEKTCRNCGKVWRPQVNTSNFFVSAPLAL